VSHTATSPNALQGLGPCHGGLGTCKALPTTQQPHALLDICLCMPLPNVPAVACVNYTADTHKQGTHCSQEGKRAQLLRCTGCCTRVQTGQLMLEVPCMGPSCCSGMLLRSSINTLHHYTATQPLLWVAPLQGLNNHLHVRIST
jgi:hypothetical protein